MKVLVAGLGSIGRRHLANVRRVMPQAEIVALSSRGRAVNGFDDADCVVTSLAEALNYGVDAAIVATPATMHVPICTELLQAGADVLVEKPLSHAWDGVRELTRLVHRTERILMVGYTLRFHPLVQLLKNEIAAGTIGRVLSARFEVGQYLPDWRPQIDFRESVTARPDLGGGALLELSHEIDYAQWILGPIANVQGHLSRQADWNLAIDDCVEMVAEFERGPVGTIHLDLLQRVAQRSCRVIGAEGTLEWDQQSQTVRRFLAATNSWEVLGSSAGLDRNQMYLDELSHFFTSIATRSESLNTLAGAVDTLRVIEAIRRSDATGSRCRVAMNPLGKAAA
ncbi:MAG TPA: Gfo/Idh/MocA family oxidoreductase [Planctomycetaceae bacterium]|nr:Gfo/Idh/MocA family oxidoreductase [Planctomycetaceae bacterium]